MSSFNSRFSLTLNECVKMALSSVEMRRAGIPHNLFYIVAAPGAGKTMSIMHEVEQKGWGFCPYSPALERLEKFGGIPDLEYQEDELRTKWSIPQMISEINDKAKDHPYVVVLFDDWHLCDEDLQRIGFEIFTYYKLNNNPIANNVIFILAGNETSAAGARIQLSAIRNRTTMLYAKTDVNYWLEHYAVPNNIHPIGISFFSNPINYDILQEAESTSEQFGSPRSWTSLFNIISFIEGNTNLWIKDDDYVPVVNEEYIHAVTQGSVSRAATERFLAHYKIYSAIDTNAFFKGGDFDIPRDSVKRYCFVTAITYEFYGRFIKETDNKAKVKLMYRYSELNEKLRSEYKEMAMFSLVQLGRFPANEEYGNKSGLHVIADMITEEVISPADIANIRNISKILYS
jgi:hypothetical protein